MDERTFVFIEAGVAAEKLGVSASGLRRLSLIYEEVYEDLPRKPKSNNRLWPEIAIERLQSARNLLLLNSFGTIKEALQAIKSGLVDEEAIETSRSKNDSTQEALHVLLREVRQLRLELREFQAVRSSETLQSGPVSSLEAEKESMIIRAARRLDAFVKRFF